MQDEKNYSFELIVTTDKMQADLMLHTEENDVRITEEELREYLKKNNIVYGLMDQAIQHFCENPVKYRDNPLAVAYGLPPVAGANGRIEYTFQSNLSDEKKPKELEDGRVDFYSIVQIPNVSRGQLLAKKVPAGAGEAGMTVTGEQVAPQKGKEAVIKLGKNVVMNEEKTLVYAAIDGQVSFSDSDKINVFPVYEVIGDVDFGVGNIDFVGTVVVRGSVPTGFRIKASGDIRILGSVEGAELEAGGSVEIRSGIVAQDKGSVVAGNDVRTSFIQNGRVTAGNDVIVSQSIMFSNVRAGRNITCNGPKGIIIGGVLQAGNRITARVIGNSSSTPTVLEVGAKPQLRNELTQLIRELQNVYENMRKTDQGLHVLDQMAVSGSLPPDKKAMQIKLRNTRIILEKEIKKMEARKKEVEELIEGESPAAVEVQSIMYPGIKLVFGRRVRFIKKEFSHTRFVVLDGEITTSTLI